MKKEIQNCIETATGMALATSGTKGINVVPVSMVRVLDGKIWLFNFFMNKTEENLIKDNDISFACWKDLTGMQIKGTVTYVTKGPVFEEGMSWVQERNAARVVRGVLIITPTEVFDLSAGDTAGVPIPLE